MKKTKKTLLCVEAALLFSFVLSLTVQMIPFSKGCNDLYDNMLRMHVIANSDSEQDQSLKLLVRDAVLAEGAEIFDGSADVQTAKEKLTPAFPRLEQTAEAVLRQNGCTDEVTISLERTYFDTRTYGDITVPAGFYEAMCVRIGRAEGHNWWCVMFPPLCLPAATKNTDAVFSQNGQAVLGSNPKYDVRFKVVELYQNAKAHIVK